MTETVTEPDVFAGYDSIASVLGFIHHKDGDEGLVELLATIEDPDRESLERYAEELEKVGLARAAELVRQHAANMCLPEMDIQNQPRWRDWMRRNRRIFKGYQITEDTEE